MKKRKPPRPRDRVPAPDGGIKISFLKKGASLPPRVARGRPCVYHLELLEPGCSMEIENATSGAVAAAVSRHRRAQPGQMFTVSKLKNGNVGVWRVK